MTEDRIAAAVQEIIRAVRGYDPNRRSNLAKILRAFAAECEEAGRYVECPKCKGADWYDVTVSTKFDRPIPCPTCDGEKCIRRELAGALWAMNDTGLTYLNKYDKARERWGAKAKDEAT